MPGDSPDAMLKSGAGQSDMFLVNGSRIGSWYNQGLLAEFKSASGSRRGNGAKWDKSFFPAVEDKVRSKGQLVAIPLGIHRMNLLLYNRQVFDKAGLRPPQNWDEFKVVANQLQKLGVVPLAQSTEPWQLAALFEAVLLSESSPEFYRRTFIDQDPSTFADTRFARALLRLRILKKFMQSPQKPLSWTDTLKLVTAGNAGMVVMGDFAKGELNAQGLTTDINFSCAAVPNTANYHLYGIDTLVMSKQNKLQPEVADRLAQLLVSPNVQADYNIASGSIPVLRNADQVKMDSCARSSWKVFANGSAVQVPSLAYDMAGDSAVKDALVDEVVRFFMNDTIPVGETLHRLAGLAHARPKGAT